VPAYLERDDQYATPPAMTGSDSPTTSLVIKQKRPRRGEFVQEDEQAIPGTSWPPTSHRLTIVPEMLAERPVGHPCCNMADDRASSPTLNSPARSSRALAPPTMPVQI